MTRRLVGLAAVFVLLALVAAGPAPALNPPEGVLRDSAMAQLQPVKCRSGDVTADGRVFPEPRVSVAFLRLPDFECAMAFLERTFPDTIDMVSLGKSRAGHDVWDVRVTDETVDGPKKKLLVISSIHGNEIGGREGAARNIEDLVDPRFAQEWVPELLRTHVVHFVFPNPDGWVRGDIYGAQASSVAWTRANTGGRDLNRNFPVQGWVDPANGPLDQPESVHVDTLLRDNTGQWSLGTDNHGQLMQPEQPTAASGLQIVGEFDYQKSETLARFGDAINDAMAEYGVLDTLEQLNQATGGRVAPYRWGTLYDILGYSASGSLIDYYNTPTELGGVGGTGFATELSVSNIPAGNAITYSGLANQVWVDSVRAINNTMFTQAIDPVEFTFPVGGNVAYVFDPEVVTDDDENGVGFEGTPEQQERWGQASYSATRMKFFDDLNEHAERPLTKLTVAQIIDDPSVLDAFDSLVVSDKVMPAEGDRGAYVSAIDAWTKSGGNLVLLDGAVRILPELGMVPESAISVAKHYVGAVGSFTDRTHPLNAGLRGIASQTYDTVPIGYRFGNSAAHSAPNWKVAQSAWEAAGGVTAGTNGTGQTIYGQAPRGDGQVTFLGALLPQPTEEYYHPFGLQNYAVTYTGYTLLQNMLAYGR
ncbi:MAG TPA: M14 family zinc carboxypeptidase [Egibacteraceae bacterium]|nr:M14 family zinc carboxypeptidase [Egibacteraceae bacterium]